MCHRMCGPFTDTVCNSTANAEGSNGSTANGVINFGNILSNLMNMTTSVPTSPLLTASTSLATSYASNVLRSIPCVMLTHLSRSAAQMRRLQASTSNNSAMLQWRVRLSKDVEDEASSYLQRIHNRPPQPVLEVDELLDILHRFKDSGIPRDQQLFLCLLRNTFEEYRFFPQYPDYELQINAKLFGGIIERDAVPTFVALGWVLRCVLYALKKPEGSKMFWFGITALECFKTQLHIYSKYCEHIKAIPHFHTFPPHLMEYVECGVRGEELLPRVFQMAKPTASPCASRSERDEADSQSCHVSINRDTSMPEPNDNSIASAKQRMPLTVTQSIHSSRMQSLKAATSIDTLLEVKEERSSTIPPQDFQNKTVFIINNLSLANLRQKCAEIKEILSEKYYLWLAQYLVLNRVSLELHFHPLYFEFLETLEIEAINNEVINETLRNIKVLLHCDKNFLNFSDRSLSRNLGNWLGLMTLARNRPIRRSDLDLKALIAEAYQKGTQELSFVVPFVAKVLGSTGKSRVFKKPNPWTMSILNLLAELHQEQDLKLNLRFEIEVLCKSLGVELSKLKPIGYLRDLTKSRVMNCQMSQPKSVAGGAIANRQRQPQQTVDGQNARLQSMLSQQSAYLQSAISQSQSMASASAGGSRAISGSSSQSVQPKYFQESDINTDRFQQAGIYSAAPYLQSNPAVKQLVLISLEQTVAKWLQPVVECSKRIASKMIEQIIRKRAQANYGDFQMCNEAHRMAQYVAARKATFSHKARIRQTLNNNFRKGFTTVLSVVTGLGMTDIETTALSLTNDNIELACSFVLKIASENTVSEVDRLLSLNSENTALESSDRTLCESVSMPAQAQLSLPSAHLATDTSSFRDKTELLLKEWVANYSACSTWSCQASLFEVFMQKLRVHGILMTDNSIVRFFYQATRISIDVAYHTLTDQSLTQEEAKRKIFEWIDAFVKLVVLMVHNAGEAGYRPAKIGLLSKVLGIVLRTMIKDQALHGVSFQQLGYHRFFIMLFLELAAPSALLETLLQGVATAFSYTYHLINPSVVPSFCYAWLELISHRAFVTCVLQQIPEQRAWPSYALLLLDLFKYMAPFLRNVEVAKPVQLMYKRTLRILLVLLKHYPGFLCDYYFCFCDVIPSNCIEMRNIILASFPRNLYLPDPFAANPTVHVDAAIKLRISVENSTDPKISTNYITIIQPYDFKNTLDMYLNAYTPSYVLTHMHKNLQISHEPGSRYNIPLMNAIVLYVGSHAVRHIRAYDSEESDALQPLSMSAHMSIFKNLAYNLDTEGRYLFLNAMANQLRYPNSHTHYFSFALLSLFAQTYVEGVKEQIVRVLLERLLVQQPHPWGLVSTFIELVKNPIYKFWEHSFVHHTPEISELFQSLARSCMPTTHLPQAQISSIDSEIQFINVVE